LHRNKALGNQNQKDDELNECSNLPQSGRKTAHSGFQPKKAIPPFEERSHLPSLKRKSKSKRPGESNTKEYRALY